MKMGSSPTILFLFVYSFVNLNYVQSVAPQCKELPMSEEFQGIFVEAFTPLNAKGQLNLAAIKTYINHINIGIKGVLALGIAGEGTSLTLKERKQVADAWAQECKANNLTIIVQVGGTNFPDVIELAKYVSKKVDAVITYPEPYYRPNSTDELLVFFRQVANAAYPAKIFYSNIPAFSEVSLNMVKFYAAAQKIRNFVGLKSYVYTAEAIQASSGINDGQSILVYDYLSIKSAFSFCLGASISAISGIFPEMALKIQNAVYEGDEVTAFNLQVQINKIVNAIYTVKNSETRFVGTFDITHNLPLVKAAMNMLTNVPVGPARNPPIPNVTSAQENQIRINLAKIGYRGAGYQGYQGESNKGEGYTDEGYVDTEYTDEGYKGEGNKGEGNKGEGYKGEGNKGEGYKGEGYKGEGNKGEGNKGEGYKGEGNKGEGYKGEGYKGKGYRGDKYME